jgi:hypothetical protein
MVVWPWRGCGGNYFFDGGAKAVAEFSLPSSWTLRSTISKERSLFLHLIPLLKILYTRLLYTQILITQAFSSDPAVIDIP